MSRQIVVVDTETGGLGPNAPVLEIAAVNIETGEEFRVVPFLTAAQLSSCEPEALAINRFYERRVFADMLENGEGNKNAFDWLRNMLDGNVFAGSNPAFGAPTDSCTCCWLLGLRWAHSRMYLRYRLGL
ncbi:hypothetical protein [Acinetobacter baumannii]|uniref:Exonuclease domain-containing protein n=1 Tax=Acinetobacter baumannii TaxID=470 RepID=A0AAJ0QT06_ACIBA|nr:hypothetical protein [Acinetobacter baumannii]KZA08646.1 hypothetical protein LV35_04172 [Acinetobacter baumannii]